MLIDIEFLVDFFKAHVEILDWILQLIIWIFSNGNGVGKEETILLSPSIALCLPSLESIAQSLNIEAG